ncbi:MAG TPA: ABC transporter ATP-binding protein [Methylomirabilota bacterium]|jgi:ABC-type Fe3+/spermidine/putrescine transport system ATPase subunit|nr:ABC transporter ATP-binding protein [Methylomirabilota bacterium]
MSRPLVDIRLEALSTRGGRPPGLDAINVHVRYGEFFTFLGPPHSGKTDVLKAVAGFMPVTGGRVVVDGQDITGLPPGRRSTGYVFQDGALWPHLTVREHVAFGLEQQGMAAAEIARRVEVVAGRLELTGCIDRRPDALTLAERRRLALARALAVEPRVLLLDEPLAHLDPLARKALRLELAKLHRDLAVTTIHVTRDAADALALSDRLAVLHGGRVQQIGEPADVYQHPVSRAVAEALGPANFLPVRVIEVRDLGVVVETDGGHRIPVTGQGAYGKGSHGLLVLRPELLVLTEAAMARGPGLPGTVTLRVFEGARHLYEIDIGAGQYVRVELSASFGDRIFRVGDRVRVETSSDTVVIVPTSP